MLPEADKPWRALVLVLVSFGVLLPGTVNNQPLGVTNRAGNPADRQTDLRRLATIGLVFGAIETEAALERAVERQLRDLRTSAPGRTHADLLAGLAGVLERSQVALDLLDRGLELAAAPRPLASSGDYRRELRKRSQQQQQSAPRKFRLISLNDRNSSTAQPSSVPLTVIERQVDEQLAQMRHRLATRIRRTVQHLQQHQGPRDAGSRLDVATVQRLLAQTAPATSVRPFQELLQSGLQHHIERLFRRPRQDQQQQGQNELAISVEGVAASGEEGESSASASSEEEDGPGGLVGLIASLSGGGDEGSDVGALIGTLSGLITNLFGPGGLDIPGLLGTGTSLIAGLLGGDDNFGKVLGSYVGIAIEGLSGGGADMNGAFFGNFLGALLAALSSDPEDESLPLRPKLFIENFFSGLQEAKRKDDPQEDDQQQQHQGGGSDLFGFITHVVSSVVGGITSLVLNASLGSSGGSSQGSVDASGASSSSSSGSADHRR
ncbi:uncharacterized protein LOC126577758 [Anopheles aquasalis]|uniref:uncharacterized protein LOC126577758 n=1 Tax=Anopheles aquasalis TaxID=42839 RepID=UPI00215B59FC|nr:uncharacterized protein LOC126577758 [Anopheles aquasalis]